MGSRILRHSWFDSSARISLKFTLGRSHSAEKHMCLVLALQARQGPNTQDQAERLMATTGHLFEEMMATYHSLGIAGKVAGNHPTHSGPSDSSGRNVVELHQRELSNVFMTVGDADIFWHPQFFSTISFEFEVTHFVVLPKFRRLTEGGATVDHSHDIQHGDVRIGGPHEPGLLISPRSLLVHKVVRPGMSSLGAGL